MFSLLPFIQVFLSFACDTKEPTFVTEDEVCTTKILHTGSVYAYKNGVLDETTRPLDHKSDLGIDAVDHKDKNMIYHCLIITWDHSKPPSEACFYALQDHKKWYNITVQWQDLKRDKYYPKVVSLNNSFSNDQLVTTNHLGDIIFNITEPV